MQVLIVDDHPLFRTALCHAVAAAVPDGTLQEAVDLASAVRRLTQAPEIDLVLLDLNLPDSRGLTGLIALRGEFPGVAVLVVSAEDDARTVRRALDFGAAGFVPKSTPPAELIMAIATVRDCGVWVPPQLDAAVTAVRSDPRDTELAGRLASLTEQQFRVLGLLAQGLLNKQIADRLGIQERTVKAHVSAILDKLGARNRTQASVLLRTLELGASADVLR